MGTKRVLNANGFTLIELMVACGVISILASIAIPRYENYAARARQSEAKASLSSFNMAESAFYAASGFYSGDFRDLGLAMNGHPLNYNVGFAGAGYSPAGWSGSTEGGCAAMSAVNTDVSPCTLSPGSLGASTAYQQAPAGGSCGAGFNPTSSDYSVTAIGDVGGGTTDVWTMDSKGSMCNNVPGVGGAGGNGSGGGTSEGVVTEASQSTPPPPPAAPTAPSSPSGTGI